MTKSFEADQELQTTANIVNIVPIGPVNDIKMDMADNATIGKMQYPSTLTTTEIQTEYSYYQSYQITNSNFFKILIF